MFDHDGDGSITFDELSRVMRVLGNNPTDEELENWMAELDIDSKSMLASCLDEASRPRALPIAQGIAILHSLGSAENQRFRSARKSKHWRVSV